MKKYKLLKDLPLAKAGEILQGSESGAIYITNWRRKPMLSSELVKMLKDKGQFDDWFEEIKEDKPANPLADAMSNLGEAVAGALRSVADTVSTYTYYYIEDGEVKIGFDEAKALKDSGNLFATREEAEKELSRQEDECKPWKPDEGDFYHFVMPDGCVECRRYCNNHIDKGRLSIGNCFKTEEDTEKAVEKLKALRRLREVDLRVENFNAHDGRIVIEGSYGVEAINRADDVYDDLETLLFGKDAE